MLDKVMKHAGNGEFEETLLPEYSCHKLVRAAKISAVGFVEGNYRLALDGGAHVDVTKNWMSNKNAVVGGYYVQYEDGYASFSPAAAFEAGYTPTVAAAEEPVEEAQGSGSERNGAGDWTQAGDGKDYPVGMEANPSGDPTGIPSAAPFDWGEAEKKTADPTEQSSEEEAPATPEGE